MVLPGVQLSDRMNNQQRKRGRQNVNRNGLGMDDTGDMSKIFGGGGNSNNNNPEKINFDVKRKKYIIKPK